MEDKLDLSNPCFPKEFLLAWRSGKTCCPDCINSDRRKVDTYTQNGLGIHYRSAHGIAMFKQETTVKQGVALLQELVACETFENLQTLSDIRRTKVCRLRRVCLLVTLPAFGNTTNLQWTYRAKIC